jgi:hypothetical protein
MKLVKSIDSHRGTHELNNQIKPRLYKETQVSTEYNLSLTWLRNARWKGNGIPFVKLGGSVFYRPEDIDAYILTNLRHSTSEY